MLRRIGRRDDVGQSLALQSGALILAEESFDGKLVARHPLRYTHAGQESGLHGGRGTDPGAGNRGQHGDLQRGRKRAAPPASLSSAGKLSANLEYLSASGSANRLVAG